MPHPARGLLLLPLALALLSPGLAAGETPPPSAVAQPEPPVLAQPDPLGYQLDWPTFLRQLPALTHERGGLLPMITWEGLGTFEPQDEQLYRDLLSRGLTQHLRLDARMIPTAKALQQAGAPIIFMQGAGGPWPAQTAGPAELWQHRLDEGYKPEGGVHACPGQNVGWDKQAQVVRETLRQYRDAGIDVAAVWMDWEGDPMYDFAVEQARHCSRCRQQLPPEVLVDAHSYWHYTWRRSGDLLGSYLAAPVREVFPNCSVTNWMLVYSTPQRPVLGWDGKALPPTVPAHFTATNPVAYGNNVAFRNWDYLRWPITRERVDQFYTNLLLRQVSVSAANAAEFSPEIRSVPWVARWCPDLPLSLPMMSRQRYREALRHIFLRGAITLQVFNPVRKGFAHYAAEEVEDAAAVYGEMLPYAQWIQRGQVLNTAVPAQQDEGPLWSGLRLGDRAVIRLFKPGTGSAPITIEPWPGRKVALTASAQGQTLLLTRQGLSIQVEAQP